MQLTLCKTTDGSNVINKSLTDQNNIDIYLKRDVDIISPTIRLMETEGVVLRNYNYCFIAELGRHYFIRSVSNIAGSIWELSLECDVLETYKNDILSSNSRFMRNIRNGDYFNTTIEHSFLTTVNKYESNKGFTGEPTMILTTIGA